MNNMNNRAVGYRVDGQGVVIEDGPEEYGENLANTYNPTVVALLSGKMPFHLQMLESKRLSPEQSEFELNEFLGVDPRSLADYVNKQITVLGACFIPHGPYKAFADKDNPDAPLREGYVKVFLLLDEVDNNKVNVVIGNSGNVVFEQVAQSMKSYGWYRWAKPVTYLVTRGQSGVYRLRNIRPPQTANTKVTEAK